MSDLRNPVIIGFISGLAVIVVILLCADLGQVSSSLKGFTWTYLPLILGLIALTIFRRRLLPEEIPVLDVSVDPEFP